MEKRESMVFYRSFYESLKDLSPIIRAEVYDGIFAYGLEFIEPVFSDPISKAMFTLIKPQLDANLRRYENGKKPKGNQSKTEANQEQKVSKEQANVNVNDNVNENDNVNLNDNKKEPLKKVTKREILEVIYPFNSEKFIKTWNEWKDYKKGELKQAYKTTISEGKVLQQLKNESGNNEAIAIEMINQAIVRGWKGIYKLAENKTVQNGKTNGTINRTDSQQDAVSRFEQRLNQSIKSK
jgi:hypothetical protein